MVLHPLWKQFGAGCHARKLEDLRDVAVTGQ